MDHPHPGAILVGGFTIPPESIRAIAEEVASILKPTMNRMDAPKQTDGLMGVDELAKHLGVSKDWIYQRTAKNEIPFVKIGHLIKFRRSDIDRWISAQVIPGVSSLSGRLPMPEPLSEKSLHKICSPVTGGRRSVHKQHVRNPG